MALPVPLLIVTSVAGTVAMVWAAEIGAKPVSLFCAMVVAAVVSVVGVRSNALAWNRDSPPSGDEGLEISRSNAGLMALMYAWGGVTLFAVYSLSGLWWWHSWQYALGMLGIAIGLTVYLRMLASPDGVLARPYLLDTAAVLALMQAAGAAGGLMFLVWYGKLASENVDWPANHVFVAGGVAIVVVSVAAAFTRFLTRSPDLGR